MTIRFIGAHADLEVTVEIIVGACRPNYDRKPEQYTWAEDGQGQDMKYCGAYTEDSKYDYNEDLVAYEPEGGKASCGEVAKKGNLETGFKEGDRADFWNPNVAYVKPN